MSGFDVGHRVLVMPLRKPGKIRTVGTSPSGVTVFGVVWTDDERADMRRRPGAVDAYVEARSLQALDSKVNFHGE